MTRIIGVLCWYDESPSWLAAAITSLAPALDHLVAVDGVYALFPDALDRPASPVEQASAVLEACAAAKLPLTLHRPTEPFWGNEVEKRSLSLALAEQVSEETDFYLVFDADEVATHIAGDFKEQMAKVETLSAEYGLIERLDVQAMHDANPNDTRHWHIEPESMTSVRGLYRALRGLHYQSAHYVVTDGEVYLWGQPTFHDLEPTTDMTDYIRLEHRNKQRAAHRARNARNYYESRDGLGIEALRAIHVEGLDGTPMPLPSN